MIKRYTPIARVGKKRKSANAEYDKRRKRYLEEHPFCQIFIKINGLDEEPIKASDGWYTDPKDGRRKRVPFATTIHHTKKPKQTYLNVESTWLSGSWTWHEWVEQHKSQARLLGVLENI